MKKILSIFILFLAINQASYAYCPHNCALNHSHYYAHGRHYYASYHHSSRYLVGKDYFEDLVPFSNFKDFSLLTKTTIYYYSDGSRRSYYTYNILNPQKEAIIEDCSEVRHISYNKEHYFIIKKNKKYKIITPKGVIITKRNYTKMQEIAPNKILVRADKKYGLINLKDDVIIPIKYDSLSQISNNLFISKLNKYYGLIDDSNNVLAKNEYDKIKTLYDTFLLKKAGKFGLADISGKILFEAQYDKIKKLGEYILIKKDKKYQILNAQGQLLTGEFYQKVRLERNSLEVKYKDSNWQRLDLSL